jgi:hypothetical protein
LFFASLLLRMKGHEGHNESGRCIAAEKTIALRQYNPRTGLGGPQGCTEPGWPSADNQDIGFGGESGDARREINGTSVLRTTKRRHNSLLKLDTLARLIRFQRLQQIAENPIGFFGAFLQGRKIFLEFFLDAISRIPRAIKKGTEFADVQSRDRRHRHF